jgi:hypothetical protein
VGFANAADRSEWVGTEGGCEVKGTTTVNMARGVGHENNAREGRE